MYQYIKTDTLFYFIYPLEDSRGDLGFPLCVGHDVSVGDVSSAPTPIVSSDVQSESVLSWFLTDRREGRSEGMLLVAETHGER